MRELGLAHLTASHRELSRFDRPETSDMPIDRDVVGRIGKYDPGALFSHRFPAARRIDAHPRKTSLCAPRCQTSPRLVTASVSSAGTCSSRRRASSPAHRPADRSPPSRKPGDFEVEREVKDCEILKFDGKDLGIPARVESKLVVGNNVSAYLILAEVLETNRWDHIDSQKFCCFDPTMTSNDLVIAINQNRIIESKLDDRPSDLVLLLVGMNARVARVGLELGNETLFDAQMPGPHTARFAFRHGSPNNHHRP